MSEPNTKIVKIKENFSSISPRYTELSYFAENAYDLTASAFDCETKRRVTIKKKHHKNDYLQILREMKILTQMKHENVLDILDVIYCSSNDDIYIVQSRMEIDLEMVLKSQQLNNDQICYIMYQILCGLKYIHSANVLHWDIKPSNIMFNANCDLKIGNFNLAKITNDEGQQIDTFNPFAISRAFRAPEILLESSEQTKAIDMWSVGCILVEMLNGRPIFKGKDSVEYLESYINILGSPSNEELELEFKIENFAKEHFKSLPKQSKKEWIDLLPNAETMALELFDKILCFCPKKRISAEEALEHPYFEKYQNEESESIASKTFKWNEMNFDDLTVEQIKSHVIEEIENFRNVKPNCV